MQRALKVVRSRASEWGVDPARLGAGGFSAGGELAELVALRHDLGTAAAADPIERLSSRPDFQVLIYPGKSQLIQPEPGSPPAFMTGYHETNFSMAYSSHVSWQSPSSPVPVELYPSLAFDNLFENRGSLRNLSILDRVKDSAETMGRRVSGTDKNKLDEYLTSVREVEKRVEGMRKAKDVAEDKAKLKNTAAIAM